MVVMAVMAVFVCVCVCACAYVSIFTLRYTGQPIYKHVHKPAKDIRSKHTRTFKRYGRTSGNDCSVRVCVRACTYVHVNNIQIHTRTCKRYGRTSGSDGGVWTSQSLCCTWNTVTPARRASSSPTSRRGVSLVQSQTVTWCHGAAAVPCLPPAPGRVLQRAAAAVDCLRGLRPYLVLPPPVCVCVCVCVYTREREGGSGGGVYVCVCSCRHVDRSGCLLECVRRWNVWMFGRMYVCMCACVCVYVC